MSADTINIVTNFTQLEVFKAVAERRAAQDAKWGVQNHQPVDWLCILGEEYGEVAKAINEGDRPGYEDELVDVAAVAMAALENLIRLRAAEKALSDVLLEKPEEAA